MADPITIRPAEPDDCPDIHRLITLLAEYEKEPDSVEGGVEDLRTALFAPSPQVFCHVAQAQLADGTTRVVGFACWFVTFSTWRVRHGIWLEDLFVEEAYRAQQIGAMLLRRLAHICQERGYARLEWTVLDWNTPAQGFYRSLGALPQDDWTTWRLSGPALNRAGSPASADAG